MRHSRSPQEGAINSAWRRIMEGSLEVVCVEGLGRRWKFVLQDEEFSSIQASSSHLPSPSTGSFPFEGPDSSNKTANSVYHPQA